MHGSYNYTLERSQVSTVHSVTAVLYLLSVLHVMFFHPCNVLCTFTLALPAVCPRCKMWLIFYSSLISSFPIMLLRYCLGDFEMITVYTINPPSAPPWRCGPTRVMATSFLKFLDHIQRRITVGRTPLDEWSARRWDLYLTTHNTHNRHPWPRLGFEPMISAGERP